MRIRDVLELVAVETFDKYGFTPFKYAIFILLTFMVCIGALTAYSVLFLIFNLFD